jgi:hypothetical protein
MMAEQGFQAAAAVPSLEAVQPAADKDIRVAGANPDASTSRGIVYLAAGRKEQASAMWDMALSLGGPLTFLVCHKQAGSACQRGNRSLSPEEVSFTTASGKKVFGLPPSKVTVAEVLPKSKFKPGELHLKVEENNYTFFHVPFGVDCGKEETAYCEEDTAYINNLRSSITFHKPYPS